MKKILMTIGAMLFAVATKADTWTDPDTGIAWTYTIRGCGAAVGSGQYYGNRAVPITTSGSVVIPSTLDGCPVTGIDRFAFYGCSGLTSVAIPPSVTSIDDDAFWECSSLTNITLSSSLTTIGDNAFYDCKGLTSIEIPSSVTSVGGAAFAGCTSLMSFSVAADNPTYRSVDGMLLSQDGKTLVAGINRNVVMPSSVTCIADGAFWGLNCLTSVEISPNVTSICNRAFYRCSSLTNVTLSSCLTTIDEYAFCGCEGLTSMEIPSGATSIGSLAFYDCTSLSRLTIPSSVTNIGSRAFEKCGGLGDGVVIVDDCVLCVNGSCPTVLDLPVGVRLIAGGAFYCCDELEHISIPSSVTSIGVGALAGCAELLSIEVTEDNANYKSIGDVLLTKDGEKLVAGVNGDVVIPHGVKEICTHAFFGCDGLTSVAIPSSVECIDEEAFIYCDALTSVTIPESATNIPERAFCACYNLKSITVPGWECGVHFSQVTNLVISEGTTCIPDYAFYLGHALLSVQIPSSVVSIGRDAFCECIKLTHVSIPYGVRDIGCAAFCYCTGLTSVSIPSSVTNVASSAFGRCKLTNVTVPGYQCGLNFSTVTNLVISEGTTTIGWCGFKDCSALKRVAIPSSVTSIDTRAFEGCSGLERIDVDEDNPNYKSVNGMVLSKDGERLVIGVNGDVVIPSGVKRIGSGAFGHYSGLTHITIPDSVESLGKWMFSYCSSLEGVVFEGAPPCELECAGLKQDAAIRYDIDHEDAWLPLIQRYGFSNACASSQPLPDGGPYSKTVDGVEWTFTVLGGQASVESGEPTGISAIPSTTTGAIAIPKTLGGRLVTRIGESAFKNCSGLTGVELSESITSIGDEAFFGCSALAYLTLPSSVTSVGGAAFAGCTSLMSFSVAADNPTYQSVDGLLLSKDGKTLVAGINRNVVIPSGVTCIGDGAFRGLNGLTSVAIPSSVTSIGMSAFEDCGGLTRVSVASSVTSIKSQAFDGCTALATVSVEEGDASRVQGLFETSGLDCSGIAFVERLSDGGPYKETVDSIEWTFMVSGGRAVLGEDSLSWSAQAIPTATTGEIAIPLFLGGRPVARVGKYAFRDCKGLACVTIPGCVTNLDEHAFSCCYGLTNVEMSSGLEIIGHSAFWGCVGLTSAEIPSSVKIIRQSAFCRCGGLTSVTIPEGVTDIENCAFSECSGLTNVVIASSVKNITYYINNPFMGCCKLLKIVVAARNPRYKSVNGMLLTKDGRYLISGVNGDVTIPDGVISVGHTAFEGFSGLTSVKIPQNVLGIADDAFENCGALMRFSVDEQNPNYKSVDGLLLTKDGSRLVSGVTGDVTIPSSVTSIGGHAFQGRGGLTSVALPSGVTRIENEVFENCVSLSSVKIPEGVTSIGALAFSGCTGLTSVALPEGVTSVGDSVFAGCTGLTSVAIPSSLTSIGNSMFDGCVGLTAITIPEGVRSIGYFAFNFCRGLASIEMPSSVTNIGQVVFQECTNLTRVTMSEGLRNIDCLAFVYCDRLESVTIPSSVATIRWRTFYGCYGMTNFVFCGDAPEVEQEAFACISSKCTATVYRGTKGWDDDGDGKWQRMTLVYRDDPSPIPVLDEDATSAEVAAALDGSKDARLQKCITNATTYAAYHAWAGKVRGAKGAEAAGTQAVKDSSTAWVSFALGSDTLLVEEPTDEDLTVEAFEPTSTAGQFDFTVSIDGVDVGSGATTEAQQEQVKENLKQVLGLEGAASLDAAAFSSDNIDLTFDTPVDGKVKFTAGPKTTTDTFFMKVKVK